MGGGPEPARLADLLAEGDLIDFGAVSPAVNALLQQGVAAYYDDRPASAGFFRAALEVEPDGLVPWFCLTKIHTYQGQLDMALSAALSGLAAAGRRGNFPADWQELATTLPEGWAAAMAEPASAQRFYAYLLKASAFVRLKQADLQGAQAVLAACARLDPEDRVGHSVIRALAERLAAAG